MFSLDIESASPAQLLGMTEMLRKMTYQLHRNTDAVYRQLVWWDRFLDYCNTPCINHKL